MIRKLVLSHDTGFEKRHPRMQLKTILNAVEKNKSFVYGEARWSKNRTTREIEFDVQLRKNSKPICSGCHKHRPGYDRLTAQSTRHCAGHHGRILQMSFNKEKSSMVNQTVFLSWEHRFSFQCPASLMG